MQWRLHSVVDIICAPCVCNLAFASLTLGFPDVGDGRGWGYGKCTISHQRNTRANGALHCSVQFHTDEWRFDKCVCVRVCRSDGPSEQRVVNGIHLAQFRFCAVFIAARRAYQIHMIIYCCFRCGVWSRLPHATALGNIGARSSPCTVYTC